MSRDDYYTHTEADAGRYERAHAEPYDDRPTPAELDAFCDDCRRGDCTSCAIWICDCTHEEFI